jgi:serine/threonine-protein phosphatase 6 regulatory ankyrin repeat subunit A
LRWAIKFDDKHLLERVLDISPGSVTVMHLLLTISHHRLDHFHKFWSLLLSKSARMEPKKQTHPSDAKSAARLIMWNCVRFRAYQILEPLLAAGFFYEEDGPLHDGSGVEHAARWGNASIMKLLLAHGAPVKGYHSESRAQPLSICAGTIDKYVDCDPWVGDGPDVTRRERLEVAEVLLKNGADVNHMVQGVERSTALHQAVAEKDVHMARLLLAHGAKVDARNINGKTPLLFNSQKCGSVAMAQLLLGHGAYIHAMDAVGNNALQIVHLSIDVELALTKPLLENGIQVVAGHDGNTVLRSSAKWLCPDLIDIYLNHSLDVNIPNERGRTPLQRILKKAGRRSDTTDPLLARTVMHLIKHGAQCDFISDTGLNALEMAFQVPLDLETMGLLVKKGMRPEQLRLRALLELDLGPVQPSNHDKLLDKMRFFLELGYVIDSAEAGGYILHEAATLKGQTALLEPLWEHGRAFKDDEDDEGRTPLMVAAAFDNEEAVTWLVNHGAGVHIGGSDGKTALHHVVVASSYRCISSLVSYRVDIESRDQRGMTPLHWAAELGTVQVAQQLIEEGADIEARDRVGRTPLHCAATYGCVDCVKVLLSGGAEPNSQDSDRRTPCTTALK